MLYSYLVNTPQMLHKRGADTVAKKYEEIERKFLVNPMLWTPQYCDRIIKQGYLNRDPDRTVRVRQSAKVFNSGTKPLKYGKQRGTISHITIKGRNDGAVRKEIESRITDAKAHELFAMCDGTVVEKHRHLERLGDHTWEVDVFMGDLVGLFVAEIELKREDESFDRPIWLGPEVTDDPRFYNSNLSKETVGELLALQDSSFSSSRPSA